MQRILLLCLFAILPAVADEHRTNVVLFLVDDMGWMDSSAYGSEYYETPNMERFAEQAMRFTDAYATPLCSPTRASILSGQYSARHGVTSASGHQPAAGEGESRYADRASSQSQYIYPKSKNYLDPDIVTLAEVLKEAGYHTGHFGKWHLGLMPEHWPETQGFETTWHCAPDPGPPSYFSPYGVSPEGKPTGQNRVGNITDGPDGEYITDRLTDEAVRFIEEHQDEPFFLNLWQYGVHGPWGHKEEYTREFAKKTDPRGEQRNPIMASMLKSVDESLGRIMGTLDELGLAKNTLFIFYSDNGGNTHSNTPDSSTMKEVKSDHPRYAQIADWKKWAGPEPPTNNAPLREGKGRIYEGGQRVPLMVRWPGHIEGGATTDAIAGPMDLYPTVLDALNLEKPAGHIVDGISLLPVLEQKGDLGRDAIFTWFPHLIPAASIRSGDWKLIQRWEPHREYPDVRELYNLKEDIGETNNLAEAMPEKVAELEAKIEEFVAATEPVAPKPNPAYKASLTNNPTSGLVPKMCEIEVIDGALRVTGTGRAPFLGTAQVKLTGPIDATLKLRGPAGTGKVQWRTAEQDDFPEDQSVEYRLKDSDQWQEVKMDLPVDGKTATVRIYVPATEGAVEVESIQFRSESGGVKGWGFGEGR